MKQSHIFILQTDQDKANFQKLVKSIKESKSVSSW